MSASVLEETLTGPQVLLLKTLSRIIDIKARPRNHPIGWRQEEWVTVDDNHCYTAMCFAGWACAIDGRRLVLDSDDKAYVMDPLLRPELAAADPDTVDSIVLDLLVEEREELMPDVDEAAAALLGLDGLRKWALFDSNNTLTDLKVIVSRLIQGKAVRAGMWTRAVAKEEMYGEDLVILDELLRRPEVQA